MNKNGTYGFVSDLPQEIMYSGAVTAKTIHIWCGEASQRIVAFIRVKKIEQLHDYVKGQNWDKISDIFKSDGSPKTCNVTTIDGSILCFYE